MAAKICAVTATTVSKGSRFAPALRYHDELSNVVTVVVGKPLAEERYAAAQAGHMARIVNRAAADAIKALK